MEPVKDRVCVEGRVLGPDGDPLRDPAGQRVQVDVAVGAGEVVPAHHLRDDIISKRMWRWGPIGPFGGQFCNCTDRPDRDPKHCIKYVYNIPV